MLIADVMSCCVVSCGVGSLPHCCDCSSAFSVTTFSVLVAAEPPGWGILSEPIANCTVPAAATAAAGCSRANPTSCASQKGWQHLALSMSSVSVNGHSCIARRLPELLLTQCLKPATKLVYLAAFLTACNVVFKSGAVIGFVSWSASICFMTISYQFLLNIYILLSFLQVDGTVCLTSNRKCVYLLCCVLMCV